MLTDLLTCTGTDPHPKYNVPDACKYLNAGTVLPANGFDTEERRYVYDTTRIVARINLHSDNLFRGATTDGKLDCTTLNNHCSKKDGIQFNCFHDRVPCTNRMEFLFGTYDQHSDKSCNFQNGLFAAVCCRSDNTCSGFACMPYWADNVNSTCRIGTAIDVRCPDNKCIYNQSEHVCNCCDTNGGCSSEHNTVWRDTNWLAVCSKNIHQDYQSCLTKNANYATMRNSKLVTAGIATIELFQDIDKTGLWAIPYDKKPTLSSTALWRKDLFSGTCAAFATPQSLPAPFALRLFTISFMACMLHVFYYECYGVNGTQSNNFYNTCPYLDGAAELSDYIDVLLLLARQGHPTITTDVPFWYSDFSNPDWWYPLCQLPQLSKDDKDGHYYLEMTMPYSMYQDNKLKDEVVTQYMSALLDERGTLVKNVMTGKEVPIPPCSLVYIQQDPSQVRTLYINPNEIKTSTTSAPVIYHGTLDKLSSSSQFLLTVTARARVDVWSVDLYAYARLLQSTVPCRTTL